MSARPGPNAASVRLWNGGPRSRIAFLGAAAWLENCCPAGSPLCSSDLTVVFDPPSVPAELIARQAGPRLGVLIGGLPPSEEGQVLAAFDRVVSFRPGLTGAEIPGGRIWRAIPPPVSDVMFAEVRPLHRSPRVMAIGRSTPHREWMLTPAKHHHDLLHVIHGVSGSLLADVLGAYDVGVYVSPAPGAGFGAQVAGHLAAGQLLIASDLHPSHGLERNLDYIHFGSPQDLVHLLDRLRRFPEMHHRVRVRGRLKAEQFRASRLFRRIAHDLLADLAAFGG